ncbi:hypothetical protein [Saccharopolyspora pogona]|uniref:hypothetical protein n=1 Tax=Saccharopolyspora pogona TaxID=333966 RepID=UPI001684E38D|nr:hypothetical protein [Saccharopolyspora pogona]
MFRKLATAIAIAAAVATGALTLAVFQAEEDSALFNCHLSGDQDCGEEPTALGFVNL